MIRQRFWHPKEDRLDQPKVLTQAVQSLRGTIERGGSPAFTIVRSEEERERAEQAAALFEGYERVLIFGTGGSALGGQALLQLSLASRVVFCDNIDPQTFNDILLRYDPQKTGAVFISKSGMTLETLSQVYCLTDHFEVVLGKEALARHMMVLTEDRQNPLGQLGTNLSLPFFELSPHIGGRFSVFSLVGLLPAVLGGMDIKAFHQGGQDVLMDFLTHDHGNSIQGAFFQSSLIAGGVNQHVVMPYVDRLFVFAQWAQQLIGESLGKRGQGVTPLAARGTVDQHSQLQLYLDGPRDKFFTLITRDDTGRGPIMSSNWIDPSMSHIRGRAMGDMMVAQHQATLQSLSEHGCFVRELNVEKVDEKLLGALMMTFMLEVVLLAHMMGVDPYDQPAVEHGKRLAKALLSSSCPSL